VVADRIDYTMKRSETKITRGGTREICLKKPKHVLFQPIKIIILIPANFDVHAFFFRRAV